MINFDVISIFPEMFSALTQQGVIAKALKNKLFNLNLHQLRDFSRNRNIDNSSYGGEGQVMMLEPLVLALNYCKSLSLKEHGADQSPTTSKTIYLSPQGVTVDQKIIKTLADNKHIILICGRYEGVDQRFIDHYIDLELSIGDFIVSGGELPAMILIDAIVRQKPNVIKSYSQDYESFNHHLLDFPHYTKPRDYNGYKIPDILISGDHKKIADWRLKQSIINTLKKRPELIRNNLSLSKEEIEIVINYINDHSS